MLRESELRFCKGKNTGLVFQEEADMLLFNQIVTDRGQSVLISFEFAFKLEESSKSTPIPRGSQTRKRCLLPPEDMAV